MSRKLFEDYKSISLINATARTTATTSSAVSVEVFEDDGIVIVSCGGGGAGFSAPVTIIGALETTPTVYNQVLATFPTVNSVGIAGSAINLNRIANIQAVVAVAGSTSIGVSVVALVRPTVKSGTNNSVTLS